MLKTILDVIITLLSMLNGVPKRSHPAPPMPERKPPLAGDRETYDHVLDKKSERELQGVDHRLVETTRLAVTLCSVKFGVHDGIRTAREQNTYFRRGTSQIDGYKRRGNHQLGRAVDLVPLIGGRYKWDWDRIFVIAEAMREAATSLGYRVRWGGNWQELTGTTQSPRTLRDNYIRRRRKQGRKAFTDGPHFEILD